MRECRLNYAHGPMKLATRTVETQYRGQTFSCSQSYFLCSQCGFELHLDWMREKLQQDLEEAYRNHNQRQQSQPV